MELFKDKNKGDRNLDNEFEDEEEEIPRKKRLKDKDFKDLNPQFKRKRKEPKKPWGKKERFFVLATLILTSAASFFLALSARNWKLAGLPRFKLPSISIPFFSEDTIVIEGNRSEMEKKEKVIEKFEEKTRNLSGVYGLYVSDLESDFSYGVNENETFQAASLIKLPVMVAFYKEVEAGNINLDETYSLRKEDKVAGSGSLYKKPIGYKVTYRDLVELMGKQSDNTAFKITRNLLGDEKINEVIKLSGMLNTSLEKNTTTPKDIGVFFENLWKGNIVNKTSRDGILESLTNTIYENHIVAGIPRGIRVAHKYGREINVVNDAGIVFTDTPFVIVIMSKGVIEREADKVIPELARIVFETH